MSTVRHPSRGLDPWPEHGPDILAPVAEHDDLRQVIRAVLARHGSIDQLRASVETPTGYSTDLWHRLASEVGVAGLAVPEEHGGLGLGMRELAVVLEECGAALVAEPVLASAVLGVQGLLQADQPASVADLLADALSGEQVVGLGWQGSAELVTARGSAGLQVLGSARRVLQGAALHALIAPATHDGAPVIVLVELPDGVATGLTVLDGTRRQADLELTGLAARVLVGVEGYDRFRTRLETLRRIAVAAEHAAIIGRLLDLTVAYVGEREQFGRAIGSFQAVKHRLADVLVDRERASSAARYAAAVYAKEPDAARLPAAVAAALCSDAVVRAAHEAVQLHGGIGFTWEHQAHLYVRRALGDEGLFGSSSRHRSEVATLIGI